VTAPLSIFAVLLAPVMAKIMPKSDARILATLAFFDYAIVFFMRSNYTTGVDAWALILPTLIIFILIIPLIWLTKPAKGGAGGAAAAAH
jgi:hypothetical protein